MRGREFVVVSGYIYMYILPGTHSKEEITIEIGILRYELSSLLPVCMCVCVYCLWVVVVVGVCVYVCIPPSAATICC